MKQQTSGVETVNSFITPKGIQRTLQVEVSENGNVDIDFTVRSKLENGETLEQFKSIPLNRREALALVFYLIRVLLPNKFLSNKWKKKEEETQK
jgi:hypothetical protein